MKKGKLFIITAPSGAGKTTLVDELVSQNEKLCVSVSHTTRPARPGEKDGVNYHFIEKQEFMGMLSDGIFLESAEVYGYHYGTSELWVNEQLAKGLDVILEIDWQGAEQVRNKFSRSKSIFILPPSQQALFERLKGRGQDEDSVIQQRVAAAKEEMNHYADADYLVINDQFEVACQELQTIIQAQRCEINSQRHEKLLIDLLS